jgi:hypothetical protein
MGQIARFECQLSALDTRIPPSRPAGVTSAAPRLLTLSELEGIRDVLVDQLHRGRTQERVRHEAQSIARRRLEAMFAAPGRHHWVRVSLAELGQSGCGAYHVRPRLGLIGMLAGWWEVKLSSGCP